MKMVRNNKGQFAKGYKHSEEWKKMMSSKMSGRKLTLEHRKKLSLIRQGVKFSNDTKRKISENRKGKCLGNTHGFRKNQKPWNYGLKNWRKNYSHSEETRKKMSVSNLGKIISEETRKKMSVAGMGRKAWNKGLKGYMAGEKNPRWKGGINDVIARRARLRGAEGSHTQAEWLALKIKYGFMCLCCKKTESEITLSEDHIIPLSKGGSNYIDNIQPLCISCNAIKNTKTINYIEQYV